MRNLDQYSQQLTLDITPNKYSISRDSGISSGDPSPNNSSPPSASQGPPSAPVTCDTVEPLVMRPRALTNTQRSSSSPALEAFNKRMIPSGRVRPSKSHTTNLFSDILYILLKICLMYVSIITFDKVNEHTCNSSHFYANHNIAIITS